jgi:hypothetical protein
MMSVNSSQTSEMNEALTHGIGERDDRVDVRIIITAIVSVKPKCALV